MPGRLRPYAGAILAWPVPGNGMIIREGIPMHIKSAVAGGLMLLSALMPLHSARADMLEGTMQYDQVAGKMEFFDGSQWYYFASGLPLGACTAPGSMDYNTLLGSYQVCNGSLWVQVAGTLTLNVCLSSGTMDYRNSTFMVCNGLLWVDIKGAVVTS